VTVEPLEAIVEARRAALGRHDRSAGRMLFVGLAFFVFAGIKLLDHLR